jgi:hypothetical protein
MHSLLSCERKVEERLIQALQAMMISDYFSTCDRGCPEKLLIFEF